MGVTGVTGAVDVAWDAVLIDGRSGSGKTSLAARALADFRRAGRRPRLLRVEDLYPGWDGLAAGADAVPAVLASGVYRRYDWLAGTFKETVHLPPGVPLIIEGCGAITEENFAAVRDWVVRVAPAREPRVCAVWLQCAADTRKSRALARDGDAFAPNWERWAAQEDAYFDRHEPWRIADVVRAG